MSLHFVQTLFLHATATAAAAGSGFFQTYAQMFTLPRDSSDPSRDSGLKKPNEFSAVMHHHVRFLSLFHWSEGRLLNSEVSADVVAVRDHVGCTRNGCLDGGVGVVICRITRDKSCRLTVERLLLSGEFC